MDILFDFPIAAAPDRVFQAVSSPTGLDAWWTARSAGTPRAGEVYALWFPEDYDWRARVLRAEPERAFELQLTEALPEWVGTRVGFELEAAEGGTHLRFHHAGWAGATDHYRTSAYCWALYLRLLARYVTKGEVSPYEARLDA